MSWREQEKIVGFPSGIWTPKRIPNLVQWLDASRGIILTSGKVSQWSDLSGNGKHCTQGTPADRPLLQHGPPFSSVSFPNITDYVNIPYDVSLNGGSGTFVIGISFRPSATTLGEGGSHNIVTYGDFYPDGWLLNQLGTTLNVYINSGGPQVSIAGFFDPVDSDVWYRIVVVCDSSTGIITVYKNGILAGTSGVTSWNITVTEDIRIGNAVSVVNGPHGALISEFVFSKSSLPSASELVNDFLQTGVLPGRTAYYPMHEGTGTTVANTIGAASNGTLTSAVWGSPAMNGKDTVFFAGTQALAHTLTLNPACTIAFVAKYDAVVANYQPVGTWSASGTTGIYLYAKPSAAPLDWGIYANPSNVNSGESLSTFKRCVLLARAINDVDLRTNGSSLTNIAGVAGYNGGAALGYSGGTQNLTGQIAEIMCYDRVLSVAECQKIEAYFAFKYGL